MVMFYADDGIIGYRDLELLQRAINFIIGLSRRVGLVANVEKYNTITCQPGVICTGISEEAFIQGSKGYGGTYRDRLWRRISCPYCGVELTTMSMTSHLRRFNGMEMVIDWD